MKPFEKRLRPFADLWHAMERGVSELRTDALVTLHADTFKTSQTNCWYATYQAAIIVRMLAGDELRRRTRIQKPSKWCADLRLWDRKYKVPAA